MALSAVVSVTMKMFGYTFGHSQVTRAQNHFDLPQLHVSCPTGTWFPQSHTKEVTYDNGAEFV